MSHRPPRNNRRSAWTAAVAMSVTVWAISSQMMTGAVGASPTTTEASRKVTICHVPPGNPANAQTIEVDANGWNGHDNHDGDYEGACVAPTTTTTARPTTTTTSTTTEAPTTTVRANNNERSDDDEDSDDDSADDRSDDDSTDDECSSSNDDSSSYDSDDDDSDDDDSDDSSDDNSSSDDDDSDDDSSSDDDSCTPPSTVTPATTSTTQAPTTTVPETTTTVSTTTSTTLIPTSTTVDDDDDDDDPEGHDSSFDVDCDNQLSDTVLTGDEHGGDDDESDDATTVTLVDDVLHGTLSLNSDGSFTYTPNEGFSGQDSFTYKVSDEHGDDSDLVTVVITVADTCPEPTTTTTEAPTTTTEAPTTTVPETTTTEAPTTTVPETTTTQVPVTFLATPVAVDDEGEADCGAQITGNTRPNDSGEGEMTTVLLTNPSHGSVVLNADGTYVYTPDEGFCGTDTFTYQVTTGSQPTLRDANLRANAVSNVATVTLRYQPAATTTTSPEPSVLGETTIKDTPDPVLTVAPAGAPDANVLGISATRGSLATTGSTVVPVLLAGLVLLLTGLGLVRMGRRD